jgi:hypothetical protein
MMSKIQNEDIKSEADLIADGGTAAQLPSDTKVYVSALSLNKTLFQAITDGDIGGGSGGGGSFVWELNGTLSPGDSTENGISFYDFGSTDTQEIYASVVVPASYSAGDQIILKDAKFTCASASGDVLFKTETFLYEPGDSFPSADTHDSTNSEVGIAGASLLANIGDLDLTDSSGQINANVVAAGDLLVVRFYRDFASETSSAADDARFVKFSANISFEG